MFKHLLTITVLCALSFLHSADSIKCYQCKSLTDANCAKELIDSSSNIRPVDCDIVAKPNVMEQLMPVTRCNKVVTSDKAGTIVSRDCHFEVVGQKPDVCTVSHSAHIEQCYTCKGDLCNASSAGRFIAMSVVGLFALVAAQLAL